VAIQYWSMRVMAGLGSLVLLLALWGGYLLQRGRLRSSRFFLWLSVWAVITPFLMNTAGWLLTESGRQPWIVQGLQKTINANSPSVSATEIWISLTVFVLAYIVLGAADLVLMLRYSRHGLAQADAEAAQGSDAAGTPVPTLTY
jgi:cytochrome d ubiquinol oxidase subunit I